MFSIIQHLLTSYSAIYDEEFFPVLREQIKRGEKNIISRKNFTGHVVADGCVIDPKNKKILMIYHATHKQWFCPGGHIDEWDSHPVEAARREVLEETWVRAQVVLDDSREPLLLHIDSHIIPASERKNEPEHWHHAMTFLFLADSTLPLPDIIDDGVASCQWVEIEKALQDERMRCMLSKIELT